MSTNSSHFLSFAHKVAKVSLEQEENLITHSTPSSDWEENVGSFIFVVVGLFLVEIGTDDQDRMVNFTAKIHPGSA